ncbi:MAG: hypothetical protein IJ724_00785 [Muribaculaceae bacterium]|nr:hypothetical protein [Muribaculaceae bacterium]MBR1725182.1 hypothetical protein [Muribaculaceae bacterium]
MVKIRQIKGVNDTSIEYTNGVCLTVDVSGITAIPEGSAPVGQRKAVDIPDNNCSDCRTSAAMPEPHHVSKEKIVCPPPHQT